MRKDLHQANRLSWNAATLAHNSHKGDQAAFFRQGGDTLFSEEKRFLGDVTGLDVVHLQCNSGQDSLGIARMGARVVGVDISDEAVTFAQGLSRDSGIPADFVRADIFDWFTEAERAGHAFDRVFASYGALCWLSDLNIWAKGIATVLRPGGRVVLVEFHPFALSMDAQWRFRHDYFTRQPQQEDGVEDYVADSGDGLTPGGFHAGVENFRNPHPSFEFQWGIGDVVTALAEAGLVLECLEEFPYSNGWRGFEGMQALEGGRFTVPQEMARIPLMYGLRARKT